jgi:hypothetical protein
MYNCYQYFLEILKDFRQRIRFLTLEMCVPVLTVSILLVALCLYFDIEIPLTLNELF